MWLICGQLFLDNLFWIKFTIANKLHWKKSDLRISNEQGHKMNGRATPIQMMKYKHSLLLFKLYNNTLQSEDWMDLNWNQSFNNRSTKVRLFDTSNIRIGKNILSNRLTIVNSQIEYDWLNKSLNSYKLICKLLFLSWLKSWPNIKFIEIMTISLTIDQIDQNPT